MARQWILDSQEGFEVSLKFQENVPIPTADRLGAREVLVKMHAASLNPREIMTAKPGTLSGPITPPLVPGCDGAGVVLGVGASVKDFRVGDRVVTHLSPVLVESKGDDAPATLADASAMLGIGCDGTLRSHGVFPEAALVHAPETLDWLRASTLTCTWTTAWNVLFGLRGQEAGPGSWVLVQGTGGVSIAALQLAVAAGCTVVATTSSDEKASRLGSLGAAHTINYRTSPQDWGSQARDLTPEKRGFDIVVDIGGDQTLPQSLAAVRTNGTVVIAGAVGDSAEPVPLFAALLHSCVVRGLLASTRAQFRELVRFIDQKKIEPAIDDVVYELAEAKEAYRRLDEKRHFAKVVMRIDHASDAPEI